MDPVFRTMRVPTWWAKLSFYLFDGNMIFRKDLESPLIFILFLKGKQNKKKKTLSVTPYLGKQVCEKPSRIRGPGYLLGRYGKRPKTPL